MLRAAVLIVFAFVALAPAYDAEAASEDAPDGPLVVFSANGPIYGVLPRRVRAPQLSGYDDPGTAA